MADPPPLPRPGQLLRTKELRTWSANPNRLARDWEDEGRLRPFGHGMWLVLGPGSSTPPAPTLAQWLHVFLGHDRYVITGPVKWNQIRIGVTFDIEHPDFQRAVVYNHGRDGIFMFGKERVRFRRRRFPVNPTTEWYIVDLMEHGDECGCNWNKDLDDRLWWALKQSPSTRERLMEAAMSYGLQVTRDHIRALVDSLSGPARHRSLGSRVITI